jgi:hypothetical protein
MMDSTEHQNVGQTLALLFGLVYLAAGVVGFAVTGFTGFVANTNEQFLGFFDLNIFHNLVHLTVGAGLVAASRARDPTVTQGVLIGLGLFYLVAAGLGFLNYLQIISINSSLSVDNFFHLFSGVAAFAFGMIAVRQQNEWLRSRGVVGPAVGQPATMTVGGEGPQPIEERRPLWDEGGTYREETY